MFNQQQDWQSNRHDHHRHDPNSKSHMVRDKVLVVGCLADSDQPRDGHYCQDAKEPAATLKR